MFAFRDYRSKWVTKNIILEIYFVAWRSNFFPRRIDLNSKDSSIQLRSYTNWKSIILPILFSILVRYLPGLRSKFQDYFMWQTFWVTHRHPFLKKQSDKRKVFKNPDSASLYTYWFLAGSSGTLSREIQVRIEHFLLNWNWPK